MFTQAGCPRKRGGLLIRVMVTNQMVLFSETDAVFPEEAEVIAPVE